MAAGAAHFLKPDYYLRIMPPWIPMHLTMIYVSGFFEILFGAMVLPVKTRRLAGWGLIALLIAVFPANIHMALHPEIVPAKTEASSFSKRAGTKRFRPSIPAWVGWARLPLQAVLIFWVWKATL